MKRWIKLLVTIVLAVSIPLQGFASISMPACNMSKASMGKSMAMNSTQINIGMNQSIEVDRTTVQSAGCDMNFKNCCIPNSSKTCADQKCATCHLTVFQLPDSSLLVIPDRLTTDYQELISEPYQTIPSALFHPPKVISA